MPKRGFKTYTIKDRAAAIATSRAVKEGTSVSRIIELALMQYQNVRNEDDVILLGAIKKLREDGLL